MSKKAIWLGMGLALAVILVIAIWVMVDSTFVVRGDAINLIENPHFDDPVRGFDGWDVAGCMTYVRPNKEAAAKAGPPTFDGACNPGQTAVISQTFTVPTDTAVIGFTYREILKGSGNHITITLDNGQGWEWVARDSGAQNSCFCFTPIVTATIPAETDALTIWIEAFYTSGIGMKLTDVKVTGD